MSSALEALVWVLLQNTTLDEFGSGDWNTAVFSGIVDLIGEGTFGVIVGAVVIVSLWLGGDRGLAAPSVATILLGALMFPILPSNFVGIGWAVVFVGLAGGFFAVLREFAL
jgi:hypothetical protein